MKAEDRDYRSAVGLTGAIADQLLAGIVDEFPELLYLTSDVDVMGRAYIEEQAEEFVLSAIRFTKAEAIHRMMASRAVALGIE